MVAVNSTMLPLGTAVPDFTLRDAVTGRLVSPSDFANRDALLLMFICNHCPYVQHVKDEIGRIAREYRPRGVACIAVNANDIEAYPQDGPVHMKAMAEAERWAFPYVLDETQEVAKRVRAACTPDFYLFDADRNLAYRGRLDDSRPSSGTPVTGRDLRAALDAVLAGDAAPADQTPSMGCNIKWKEGNEPDYFG